MHGSIIIFGSSFVLTLFFEHQDENDISCIEAHAFPPLKELSLLKLVIPMKPISPTVLFHNHRAPPSIYYHPRASHAHLLLQDRNPLTSVEGSCFPLTTSLSTCFSVACTCITSSWPCTCNRKLSRWVSSYNIRVYYQSPMILSCQNECRLANIRSKTTLGWLFLSSGSILLCLCRYLEVFCEEQPQPPPAPAVPPSCKVGAFSLFFPR